jgi:hypothetical protein
MSISLDVLRRREHVLANPEVYIETGKNLVVEILNSSDAQRAFQDYAESNMNTFLEGIQRGIPSVELRRNADLGPIINRRVGGDSIYGITNLVTGFVLDSNQTYLNIHYAIRNYLDEQIDLWYGVWDEWLANSVNQQLCGSGYTAYIKREVNCGYGYRDDYDEYYLTV